jgi:branched-chain amino acid transport system ATP-binding protein
VLLKITGINTFLGKGHILNDVSLEIQNAETIALLGRNGVGKSTTVKSIIGLTPPANGSIQFLEREIIGLRPYKISRMGIGYVPEDRRIFPHLTVRENILIGFQPKQRAENPWTLEKIYNYFPRLRERDGQKGGKLSGGEQQMLTIGRTLAGNPILLLIDEPTEGLSPILVDKVGDILRKVNEEGRSVLLIEHSMDTALMLAKRVYVMSKGSIVYEGTSQQLAGDEAIKKKYHEV